MDEVKGEKQMKKRMLLGILAAAAVTVLAGCAGSTVEIGPVPSITPKPTLTPLPSPTPTPVPDDPNRKDFKVQYEKTGKLASLADTYQDYFLFGVAVCEDDIKDENRQELIKQQFNSLTCLYEMTPEYILDEEAMVASGNPTTVILDFSGMDTILDFAQENGMTVRSSALITHDKTPDWFFTPDYVIPEDLEPTKDTDGDGVLETIDYPKASAEVMEARMESLIRQVMEHCNEKYPGLVSAWDVVEEAIAPEDKHPLKYRDGTSGWHTTMGDDYIVKAYEYARQYATKEQKLFYSEYKLYEMVNRTPTVDLVTLLKEKGLLDGIAVQGHWTYQTPNTMGVEDVFKSFFNLGLEVHISEFDIDMTAMDSEDADRTDEEIQSTLSKRLKNLFAWFVRVEDQKTYDFASITVYGLTDNRSWYNQPEESVDAETGETVLTQPEFWNSPVLFFDDLTPKDAFFATLQDENIKAY